MIRELRLFLLLGLGLSTACEPTIAEVEPGPEPEPTPTHEDDYGECDPEYVETLEELQDGESPARQEYRDYLRCETDLSYEDCMVCDAACQQGIVDGVVLYDGATMYATCGPMWLGDACCVVAHHDLGWDEGRPFLVGGQARLAASCRRGDWGDPARVRPVDADVAAALVARWTRTARMEHASVAAFSRFSLVLLHLGAAAELVEQAHVAALDEARHARLCFGLAAAYAGHAVGPAGLPVEAALTDELDPDRVLRTLFLEGCLGETIAAMRARVAASKAKDPVVSQILEGIAADEARHAALAWKTVRWLISEHPELRSRLAELLASDPPTGEGHDAAGLEAHGVLGPAACMQIAAEVHAQMVLPIGRALLAEDAATSAAQA